MDKILPFKDHKKKRRDTKQKMKGCFIKRGKYYHYFDSVNRRKTTTKQATLVEAKLWVEKNIILPRKNEELGLEPTVYKKIKEVAEEYLSELKLKATIPKKMETLKKKENLINKILKSFGDYKIQRFDTNLVTKYMIRRLNEDKKSRGDGKVSPVTINREVYALSSIFTYAKKRKYIKVNSLREIEMLTEPKYKGAKVISKEDFKEMLRHFNKHNVHSTTEFLIVAFLTEEDSQTFVIWNGRILILKGQ